MFKASLVYRASSRTARAAQRNPVSKKKKKKKKKGNKRKKERKEKRKRTLIEIQSLPGLNAKVNAETTIIDKCHQ